jgi:hypothetical protein
VQISVHSGAVAIAVAVVNHTTGDGNDVSTAPQTRFGLRDLAGEALFPWHATADLRVQGSPVREPTGKQNNALEFPAVPYARWISTAKRRATRGLTPTY